MNVLVTGGNGFLGSYVIKTLSGLGINIKAPVRNKKIADEPYVKYTHIKSLDEYFSAPSNLLDVDVIVHIAALAHGHFDEAEFQAINTELPINIAKAAVDSGVRRLVFLSSIGVNGNQNESPFTSDDTPNPTEEYAKSKYFAEEGIKEIAKETSLEVVIVRPPLIYGKNAPGNFKKLMKLSSLPLPLPLGSINNKRSFVSVHNLVDLITICLSHTAAVNQTFLVSDDEDVSTSQLLAKMLSVQGKPNILLPIPVSFLKLLGRIVKRQAIIERFTNSLTVDIEHTKKTLGWLPPISLDEGIARCFHENHKD